MNHYLKMNSTTLSPTTLIRLIIYLPQPIEIVQLEIIQYHPIRISVTTHSVSDAFPTHGEQQFREIFVRNFEIIK